MRPACGRTVRTVLVVLVAAAAPSVSCAPASAAAVPPKCSTRDGRTWSALAPGETSGSTGGLDLWVDNHRAWTPSPSSGGGCNTTTHTYVRTLTFPTTGPLALRVADTTHGDDSGALKVAVQRV